MGRKRLRRGVLTLCLLAGMPTVALAELPEPYPGVVVTRDVEKDEQRHRVILGSLEKIRNVLEPEAYETVAGKRHAITYSIPGERRLEVVVRHYRVQMEQLTSVLFSCDGRQCGSSNYWANTVFDNSILYGPEQYQNYVVGREKESGDYLAVYVAQRGTRDIYVHVEHIVLTEPQTDVFRTAVKAALDSAGLYTYYPGSDAPDIPSLATVAAEFLRDNPRTRLVIVGHDQLGRDESIENAMRRTLGDATFLKEAILAEGTAKEQLEAYGVGPLAPRLNSKRARLELIAKKRLRAN